MLTRKKIDNILFKDLWQNKKGWVRLWKQRLPFISSTHRRNESDDIEWWSSMHVEMICNRWFILNRWISLNTVAIHLPGPVCTVMGKTGTVGMPISFIDVLRTNWREIKQGVVHGIITLWKDFCNIKSSNVIVFKDN